jgi:voltage-gated potassium channel
MAASTPLRRRLFVVIFEADTPAGKAFDVGLLIAILASIFVVMLETVPEIGVAYASAFFVAEWIFTALFTVEYCLRLSCVERRSRYVFSFFGLVDLLALLPTYLSLLIPGSQTLTAIRSLRLMRVFRIFKLGRYLKEAAAFRHILRESRPKIVVFLTAVLIMVSIVGAAMHLIEGPENGFTSVPKSMYWAIVTMTTVGYGDITPQTVLGKGIASLLMVVGYSLIVVPTGILSASAARVATSQPVEDKAERACSSCDARGHGSQARHCDQCGAELQL